MGNGLMVQFKRTDLAKLLMDSTWAKAGDQLVTDGLETIKTVNLIKLKNR